MTDRDRLIELLSTAGWNLFTNDRCKGEIADYLLANGVIVPPCKVGDTVYVTENPYTFYPLRKPVEGEVVSIHLHEHGLYLRVLFDTKKINGCVDYNLS